MRAKVAIIDGYPILMNLYEPYKYKLNEYNMLIKDSGYYLKPLHFVYLKSPRMFLSIRYVYFGRYWYRVYRVSGSRSRSKIRWIYVGKEKPDPTLPDPPLNPFEGLYVLAVGSDVLLSEKSYKALVRISESFRGVNVFEGKVVDLTKQREESEPQDFWPLII
ncbi:MAG: hypothetical protein ACK416_01575 [Zestosphaera sp.]